MCCRGKFSYRICASSSLKCTSRLKWQDSVVKSGNDQTEYLIFHVRGLSAFSRNKNFAKHFSVGTHHALHNGGDLRVRCALMSEANRVALV